MSLILENETYAIIGAAFEVYKQLRDGFSEYVYQDALEQEFKLRGIPYEREKKIRVSYKGVMLNHEYYADFVCYGNVMKAVSALANVHRSQVINYLRATGYHVALLLNFGLSDGVEHERIVL